MDVLMILADKAYLDLQEEARNMLALYEYMDDLTDPRISFSVRQKCPKTVTEAVLATIELETYLPMNCDPYNVTSVAAAQQRNGITNW